MDTNSRVIFTNRILMIKKTYTNNNEDKLSLARCSVTKGCVRWQDNTPGKLMVSENRNNRYIYMKDTHHEKTIIIFHFWEKNCLLLPLSWTYIDYSVFYDEYPSFQNKWIVSLRIGCEVNKIHQLWIHRIKFWQRNLQNMHI